MTRRASNEDIYTKFWPEAKKQQEKAQEFFDRFKGWKIILDEIEVFVKVYASAQENIGKEAAKLGKVFDRKEVAGGSLRIAQESLTQLRNRFTLHYKDSQNELVKKVHSIKSEVAKKTKEFKSETDKHLGELHKSRVDTLDLLRKHDQSTEMVKVKKSREGSIADPWLTEKALSSQVEHVVSAENEVRQKLVDIHKRMADFDSWIIGQLQPLMSKFGNLACSHSKSLEATLTPIQNYVSSPQGRNSFSEFASTRRLSELQCFHSQKSLEEFPIAARKDSTKDILEEAVFGRQRRFRTGKFKDALYVLTENGFLHCFEMKSSKEKHADVISDPANVMYSVYLRAPRTFVEKSKRGTNIIEITVHPNSKSIFASKKPKQYLIQADSEKAVEKWIEEISKFLCVNNEMPVISSDAEADDAKTFEPEELAVEEVTC